MGKRSVTALGTNPLDARLVLVEVNVRDHLVELDSGGNIVAPVMAILVVVEAVGVQNDWSLFLVK